MEPPISYPMLKGHPETIRSIPPTSQSSRHVPLVALKEIHFRPQSRGDLETSMWQCLVYS